MGCVPYSIFQGTSSCNSLKNNHSVGVPVLAHARVIKEKNLNTKSLPYCGKEVQLICKIYIDGSSLIFKFPSVKISIPIILRISFARFFPSLSIIFLAIFNR
jgi:hypothetical protein